jgi:hypothetical protein
MILASGATPVNQHTSLHGPVPGGRDACSPMLPSMWKVMKLAHGEVEEIWTADFAAAPGTQLTIDGKLYEVIFHEGNADRGWVYVTPLSARRG